MVGIDEDLKYEVPPLNIDPNTMGDENRKRRFSVSAESSDDKKVEKFVKKVYPKSKEALQRIKQSTCDVFLFQGCMYCIYILAHFQYMLSLHSLVESTYN